MPTSSKVSLGRCFWGTPPQNWGSNVQVHKEMAWRANSLSGLHGSSMGLRALKKHGRKQPWTRPIWENSGPNGKQRKALSMRVFCLGAQGKSISEGKESGALDKPTPNLTLETSTEPSGRDVQKSCLCPHGQESCLCQAAVADAFNPST